MVIETAGVFLFRCALFNYAVLIVWFAGFSMAQEQLYRHHSRWFRLTIEQFDALNYALMGFYKIGILLLCVAPYVTRRFIG